VVRKVSYKLPKPNERTINIKMGYKNYFIRERIIL